MPRDARTRRRRTRRGAGAAIVLAIAVWLGVSGGLFGGRGEGTGDGGATPTPLRPEAAAPEEQPRTAARGTAPETTPETTAEPTAEGGARSEVASGGSGSNAGSAGSDGAARRGPSRSAGDLLRAIRAAGDGRGYGAAFAAVAEAEVARFPASAAAELAAAADELRARLDAEVAALDDLLAEGRVLALEPRLLRFWEQARSASGAPVAMALAARGWGPQRLVEGAAERLGPAAPLAPGTPVRVVRAGEVTAGEVVTAGADAVTVRVENAGRVRFPTVPRLVLEPGGTAGRCAFDQAVAAIVAGRPALAFAWLRHGEAADDADPLRERLRAAFTAG